VDPHAVCARTDLFTGDAHALAMSRRHAVETHEREMRDIDRLDASAASG
jgi:hypothetical protein